jgi:proton-dependent oligopeptide transporter, POT family
MKNVPQEKSFKQPKIFYYSTIMVLGERIGSTILIFLLTLFLKNYYHFSDTSAFAIFAIFSALSCITPVIGGYLADNYLGIKRCMGLGLFFELSGYIILSLPLNSMLVLNLALSLILTGIGLFKTGPTNLMGRSYSENDCRIDSGFTLYYMGINIGGFIASICSGVYKIGGWNAPFMLSSVGILFAIIWFFCFRRDARECDVKIALRPIPIKKWLFTSLGVLIFVLASMYLFRNGNIAKSCFYVSIMCLMIFFMYQIIISPRKEKLAIVTTIILMFMAMFFFLLYFQIFTSVTLYIDRCVDRKFFSFTIPTVFLLGLNPIFIFIFSPFLALLYKALAKRNNDLLITIKLPLGLLLTGFSFLLLYISTFVITSNGKTSLFWIIFTFSLFAAGELLTSALGVAMITQIAPKRLYGVMMGGWFLIGLALAADLAGSLASLTSIPTHLLSNELAMSHIYGLGFLKMSSIAIIIAIIGFILSPWLQRMINAKS